MGILADFAKIKVNAKNVMVNTIRAFTKIEVRTTTNLRTNLKIVVSTQMPKQIVKLIVRMRKSNKFLLAIIPSPRRGAACQAVIPSPKKGEAYIIVITTEKVYFSTPSTKKDKSLVTTFSTKTELTLHMATNSATKVTIMEDYSTNKDAVHRDA